MDYGVRICKVCGKEYIPKTPSAKYCSKECGREAMNASRRKPLNDRPIQCAECGQLFSPKSNVQKYCCNTCYERAKRRMKVANREVPLRKTINNWELERLANVASKSGMTYGQMQQQETIRRLRENGFWG